MVDRSEYRDLIALLETEARRDPRRYRLRVVGWALLGYGFAVGAVALLVLLAVLSVRVGATLHGSPMGVRLAILFGVWAAVVAASFWVRLPAPSGLELRREQAPRLFQELDALARSLEAPRVDRVWLDTDLNASVQQRPRLGVFGWWEQHLTLGLTLLSTLTPAQCRAILAHELGHLSGQHGRTGVWLARCRIGWEQLMFTQRSSPGLLKAFGWFFRWYAPRFDAWTFVLGRQQEYEADRAAVRLSGGRAAPVALARLAVLGGFLRDQHAPTLWKEIGRHAAPRPELFERWLDGCVQPLEPSAARKWLAQELALATDLGDTHPALADRLRALGVGDGRSLLAEASTVAAPSAAERYLGTELPALRTKLAERWCAHIAEDWKRRHAEYAKHAGGAPAGATPANSRPTAPGTADADWGALESRLGVDSPDELLPDLQRFAQEHPQHALAHLHTGALLVQRRDERGLVHLDLAMSDPYLMLSACGLAYDFHWKHGNRERADEFARMGRMQQQMLERSAHERTHLDKCTHLEPHGLAPEARESLRAALARDENVERAWLVRRDVVLMPERPAYVLAALLKGPWLRRHDSAWRTAVAQRLLGCEGLPPSTLAFALASDGDFPAPLLRDVLDARVL